MPFISEKRAAASSANGARSCGPKTREGKARASINALRPGLAARTVDVLAPTAENDRAEAHFRRALNTLGPTLAALRRPFLVKMEPGKH